MKKIISLLVAATALLCFSFNAKAQTEKFKDFTVTDYYGKTVKLSDYAGNGKLLLVDFWASWCGPCRAEIPNIKKIYLKYKDQGLDVLSIAVSDKPKDTIATANELGITWNQIVGAGDVPADLYGVQYIPYIILIGRNGEILAKNIRGEEIEEAVKKALGK